MLVSLRHHLDELIHWIFWLIITHLQSGDKAYHQFFTCAGYNCMLKALTVTFLLFKYTVNRYSCVNTASFYLLPSPLLTSMHQGFVTGYLFTVCIFVIVCVSPWYLLCIHMHNVNLVGNPCCIIHILKSLSICDDIWETEIRSVDQIKQ